VVVGSLSWNRTAGSIWPRTSQWAGSPALAGTWVAAVTWVVAAAMSNRPTRSAQGRTGAITWAGWPAAALGGSPSPAITVINEEAAKPTRPIIVLRGGGAVRGSIIAAFLLVP
jgi:hypothetical protein